jgi:uncharacterized protein YjiK
VASAATCAYNRECRTAAGVTFSSYALTNFSTTDDGASVGTTMAYLSDLIEDNLSGGSFDEDRCSLWMVQNNPCSVYEIDPTTGELIRWFDLQAGGFYGG